MKWVALVFALLGIVPALGHLAAKHPRARTLFVTLLAFELFNPLHVNLYSDETYRGESRGFEVTSVDVLILGLALAQRLRRARPATTHRFVAARWIYFGVVVLSALAGSDVLRSAFSIWKLGRMYLAFNVLAGLFQEMELANAALLGLAYGV